VQVLEHKEQRLLLGELREKLGTVPEQSRLAVARVVLRRGARFFREGRTDCAQPVAAAGQYGPHRRIETSQQIHEGV
jgi:hypothetical protein